MHKLKLAAIAAAALALPPAPAAAQQPAMPVSLGMALDHMAEDDSQGPEVTAILPGRTGAALGFKVGDILVEAGGRPISPELLRAYIREKKAGDRLSFKVKRAVVVVELAGTALAAPEGAPAPAGEPRQ